MPSGSPPPFIYLENIFHSYGDVPSLNGASIALEKGEIHALVGEHGAGKSSLAKIISGDIVPRSGRVLIDDVPILMFRSQNVLRHGIKVIYQDILLNSYFSVAESMFYANRVVNPGFWVSRRKMEAATQALFAKNNIRISPTKWIRALNISERTVVDIIRSIQTETSLLLIDEGLDNLAGEYYSTIVSILRRLAASGIAILFITHKIEDIYDVADKVSIMRNGRILATDKVKNIDKMSLLRLTYTQINRIPGMVGDVKAFNNLLKYNEAILRFLPINLIVTDAEHRIELVNNNCKAYFRLQEDYHNMPLSELIGKDNHEVLALLFNAIQTGEERTYYRVNMATPNGHAVTNIKTLPIRDGSFVIGNIVIIEDVSEFEMLQDKLILSEKLASIGLLAAGVAHEINNPLEIIYNYLAFIKFNLSDPALLKIVDTVQKEMVTISGIVSNLVSFSNTNPEEHEALALDAIIKEIIELLKFNAKYKNISLCFHEGLRDSKVRINRNEFKQVILNLLRNSFESMADGGEIIISTEIAQKIEGAFAKLTVQDSGSGIPEENLKNIFLPFYSTKKGSENNLGLGLSISYGIVQRFGGTISAANNPEKGCSFTIEFPIL
jgi:signal transduction histidine kinase